MSAKPILTALFIIFISTSQANFLEPTTSQVGKPIVNLDNYLTGMGDYFNINMTEITNCFNNFVIAQSTLSFQALIYNLQGAYLTGNSTQVNTIGTELNGLDLLINGAFYCAKSTKAYK
mmetsp:Transcript_22080/g.18936  ORF Transcript_22080/g.18936 Transcript_22080/m.18936 type:complete len:119 (-) Transcript_22080:25-381(-)